MRNYFKKTINSVLMIFVCWSLSVSVASAEKVNIGVPNWTGAKAVAHLLQAVIVDRMGGQAELVPGNNASIFQAMDAGKGDIDVHPDVWLPNQQSFTKKICGRGWNSCIKQSPI